MPLQCSRKWFGKAAYSNEYGLYKCMTTYTDVLLTLQENVSTQKKYYRKNTKAVTTV